MVPVLFSASCVYLCFLILYKGNRTISEIVLLVSLTTLVPVMVMGLWLYAKHTHRVDDWVINLLLLSVNFPSSVGALFIQGLPLHLTTACILIHAVLCRATYLWLHVTVGLVAITVSLYNATLVPHGYSAICLGNGLSYGPLLEALFCCGFLFFGATCFVGVHFQGTAEKENSLATEVARKRKEMLDYVFHEIRNPCHVLRHVLAAASSEAVEIWPEHAEATSDVAEPSVDAQHDGRHHDV